MHPPWPTFWPVIRPDAAVMEMTMLGGYFRFSLPAYLAVCGADMQGELNGHKIKNWSAFPVAAGDELAFGHAVSGCRSYLAFRGGIAVPKIMGSRSTCLRAQIGGYEGRALRAGDLLEVAPAVASASLISHTTELVLAFVPHYPNHVRLRVMLGPQDDLFTSAGVLSFMQSEYAVSAQNDRMGYRLEGPAVAHRNGADVVSDWCPAPARFRCLAAVCRL